jgi:hypothetical protein
MFVRLFFLCVCVFFDVCLCFCFARFVLASREKKKNRDTKQRNGNPVNMQLCGLTITKKKSPAI